MKIFAQNQGLSGKKENELANSVNPRCTVLRIKVQANTTKPKIPAKEQKFNRIENLLLWKN